MRLLAEETKWFFQQKIYVIAVALTAVCSYGFLITHPSIGIDDTAMELYLTDGIMVEMGRWVMYLLNKIFFFGEFAPFCTDLIGVLFMVLAAALYCVLLRRILGERADILVCTVFSCVFLSNPILGRVFVYYFHNGVGLGYVLSALALLSFHQALGEKGKGRVFSFFRSMLFIWLAVGCYESFLILYILGILVVLFLQGTFTETKLSTSYVLGNLGVGAGLTVGCMLLRALVLPLVIAVFRIDAPDTVLSLRSISEMLVLFQGKEGLQELFMLAKRFWLVYHVNALVYLPITGYELACFCVGICSLVMAVKKKNLWYPVLFAGMWVTPFLLTVAEAKLTFYRSCQYLPFFTAVGILLLYLAWDGKKHAKWWKGAVIFLGAVLIWRQATGLNKLFYMDYRQYELTKETLISAAFDVERKYGTEYPIVFVGEAEIPYELTEEYYVSYDSWQYRGIAAITDMVDVHLKEKYFQPQGYCFIGEANLPVIRWGFDAFDGTNRELIHFLQMHGYSYTTVTDMEILDEARAMSNSLPHWPAEGSIVLQDGYVLINF